MKKYTRYAVILLPEDPPFASYFTEKDRQLGPLSLVNIFVGANNSGKSRLLRSLFSFQEFSYTTNHSNAIPWHEFINDVGSKFEGALSPSVTSIGGITADHLKDIIHPATDFFSPSTPTLESVITRLKHLLSVTGTNMTSGGGDVPSSDTVARRVRGVGKEAMSRLEEINVDRSVGDEKRYYIPILRGMRPLDTAITNHYQSRTLTDYFQNSLPANAEIFTGLELYQTLKAKLLGEPEDREAVKRFEEFLSKKFFASKQITLIPREGDITVHIKIGNERQLPIHQLGDGLQGLIICTFNIFIQEARTIFFIEEPDMCMHPSLQRSFLEVLSEFDQHQYFVTSHSNHLLDMTIDFSNISIFHFSKSDDTEPHFDVRVASSRDRRVLLDLGVRNSSVFLTNATIWIEGMTDRLYLRAYLARYIREVEESDSERALTLNKLKEDYHYSFIEYQGANLTHWSFDADDKDLKRVKADYVCAHAFLIADGDVATKGNRETTYREMLSDRFVILSVKEIENLMPPEVLKEVVASKFKSLGKSIDLINDERYTQKNVFLGEYLDSLIELPDGESLFSTETGTIKSKVTFCERALKFMNDGDSNWSLTPALRELCEKVFAHIIAHNRTQGVNV